MTQEYSMTDQDLRGLVLQQFYAERRLEFSKPSSSWINADLDDNEIYRICAQLAECALITFKPNINGARGKITAHGIDSIEREDSLGETIQFVSHHTTNVENSSNIIVGSANSQTVGYSCDQIAKAIDSSSRPDTEKAKSKNLLENDTSMSSSQRPTDILLRGLVLQSFYDKRKYGVFLSPSTAWVGGKAPIEEVYRICSQLREHNLIKWEPFQSGGGIGQITAYGSDVIEGAKTSDIALQITHNYTTIANSNNVIVVITMSKSFKLHSMRLPMKLRVIVGLIPRRPSPKAYLHSFLIPQYSPKLLAKRLGMPWSTSVNLQRNHSK